MLSFRVNPGGPGACTAGFRSLLLQLPLLLLVTTGMHSRVFFSFTTHLNITDCYDQLSLIFLVLCDAWISINTRTASRVHAKERREATSYGGLLCARDHAKHPILTQLVHLGIHSPILQETKMRPREVMYLVPDLTACKRFKYSK